jgi:prepilin-type N-terminal cleavage/methylation domain-containing protein
MINLSKKTLKGFTLVELLVVVSVIGLLSSIILVAVKGAREKATITKYLQFSVNIYHALGDEIIGEWAFNEGSGGVVGDTSDYNNDGTWRGSPSWVANDISQLGTAGNFTGSNWVVVPSSDSLNITKKELTIEVWIKPDFFSSIFGTIAYKGNSTFLLRHRQQNGGNSILFIMWRPDGTWCYFSYAYSDMALNWRHLVITYNGSNIRGFANGEEFSSSLSCNASFRDNLIEQITIGATDPTLGSFRFYGNIDNLRIYTRPLSQAEIQQHYAEGAAKHGLAIEE